MTICNPEQDCKKYSNECLRFYIHKGALKRNINTN